MAVRLPAGAKYTTIRATVIRADGRVEPYGAVAFAHRNPIVNWAGNLFIKIKRRLTK